MRKITKRTLGLNDKIMIFRWIGEHISSKGENTILVVGGLGVVSQKIKKSTFNFKGKAWRTLAQHRLCATIGDDVLRSIRAAMIAGFIVGYEFDMVEFLS